jgi:hypothetical protein
MHTSPRKEKNTEINQITRRKHGCEHQSQQHTPLEGNRAVDACNERVNNFFLFYFILTKTKLSLELNYNNKKTIMKLLLNP